MPNRLPKKRKQRSIYEPNILYERSMWKLRYKGHIPHYRVPISHYIRLRSSYRGIIIHYMVTIEAKELNILV